MKSLSSAAVFAVAFAITAAVLADSAGARQRPQPQPSEAARQAREQEDRELQELMKLIEQNEQAWREETNKNFEATKQERDEFDRKLKDFADKQPKPPGTVVTSTRSFGDDGLPRGGEVTFTDPKFNAVTHRAGFDEQGNTTGLAETPNARALQNFDAHLPKADGVTWEFTFATGLDGNFYITEAKCSRNNNIDS